MTKTELIAAVVERAETGEKDTEAVINAAMDIIKETVAGGSDVQLIGFGTFTIAERAERTGRNPQTGEEMKIAAAKTPEFKPGKAFKDAVNVKKDEKEQKIPKNQKSKKGKK